MDKLVADFNVLVENGMNNISSVVSELPGGAIIYRYVSSSYQNDPARSLLEFLLFLFAIRYFLASKYSTSKSNYVKLNEEEIDELVDEWEPEPLVSSIVPGSADDMENNSIPVLASPSSGYVTLSPESPNAENLPKNFINFTSCDVYGFNTNKKLQENALKIISQYGVGSCGPAGFYGNQDAHVNAEKSLAKLLGTESSILYSQGNATASSVIPCFLKRGDVIVADKGVNIGIQKGILLSRSSVFWYEHNDVEDLERTLIRANGTYRGRGPLPRRFIITESFFENSGEIVDLAKIIELKKIYKYRLALDETWSIGNIGKTGKGLPEALGINRAEDIDISFGSLSSLYGCGGGYCAAESAIIEHQRITSLAYTFSATMPPYLASTISQVAEYMATEEYFAQKAKLEQTAKEVHGILETSKSINITSVSGSPVIIFTVDKKGVDSKVEVQKIIDNQILPEGVLVTRHNRLVAHEIFPFDDRTIRLFIHSSVSSKDMVKAAKVIAKAFA